MPLDNDSIALIMADVVKAATAPLLARIAVLEAQQPIVGRDGLSGKDGAPGAGIGSLLITADGRLMAHLTDGRSLDVGPVPVINGKDGADGRNGKDGTDGLNGKDGAAGLNGKDGADGQDGVAGRDGKDGSPGLNGKDGAAGIDGKDGASGVNGKDGQNGADGAPGRDGKDAEPWTHEQVINALRAMPDAFVTAAADYFAAHPVTNGRDGVNGKDGVDGLNGKDGANGRDGIDGKDGAPGLNGKDGTNGIDGEDGAPGLNGKDGIDGKDGAPGLNGKDGAPGLNGTDGLNGKDGANGLNGKDGIGVASALITRHGELALTLSDGTVRELGPVLGQNGRDGLNGKDVDLADVRRQVLEELAKIPMPKDGINGKDGLGFDDFELRTDDTGCYLRLVRGDQVKEQKLPVPYHRDVWQSGITYDKGNFVTWDGAWWIAKEQTAERPGNGATSWRLTAKRGPDGKQGPEGKPGRDGRDLTNLGPDGSRWGK